VGVHFVSFILRQRGNCRPQQPKSIDFLKRMPHNRIEVMIMLDEKDLQAIQAMMDQQKREMLDQSAANMRALEQRVLDQSTANMRALEQRVLDQSAANMRALEQRVLDQSAANMRAILEECVEPKLRMLAEGQKTLLETLAPKSRVEELEEEVAFLKSIIRLHSDQIAELKKAQ